jgi:uncharacterized membrane protein YbhN (UPF0104 family)
MEQRQPLLHRIGEAGARFGTSPPRSKRVRLAIQLGLALLIFGFLVLTVVDQWSEIKDKGVHFHVLWLIPAFIVLPIYYALSALGWDLILRFLGYRIGIGRAQVARAACSTCSAGSCSPSGRGSRAGPPSRASPTNRR